MALRGITTRIKSSHSRISLKYGSDIAANENDVLQYQGQEVDFLFLDEATQLTEQQYTALTACVRGVNDFPKMSLCDM